MCNRDCFNCPYADCIDNTVSDDEKATADGKDRKIENDMNYRKWVGIKGEKARHERYRYKNNEKYREKSRNATRRWREKNPGYKDTRDRREYQHQYYLRKKGAIQ